MKPLNLDNRPCSPISSNCVIWQGDNIPCINLCTGDTVSDVVAALATELCGILEQINVSTYDLSCLGVIGCGPKDFHALIELLISKICELENIPTGSSTAGTGECPDCVVSIASCFQTGSTTTMQLLDYVQMIGQRICTIVDDIADINASITDLYIRVEALENATTPTFTLPAFTISCQIGTLTSGTNAFIDVILQQFINNVWCPFYAATGTTGDLLSAVNAICISDSDPQLSSPTDAPFSANPNWIQSSGYGTVADAINNIWVALCDLYTYTSTIESTVIAAAVVPTGAVMPWAGVGSLPPSGWAFCDGQAISRTTYATLFSVVSTTYGNGDGSTTFNIPDLQQKIPVGQGLDSGGYTLSTLGATGGNVSETLTTAQIPTHTHDLSATSFTGTISGSASGGAHGHTILGDPNGGSGSTLGFQLTQQPTSPYDAATLGWIYDGAHTHSVTGTATGTLSGSTGDGSPALQGTPHGNMQPYVIMRYIIKL